MSNKTTRPKIWIQPSNNEEYWKEIDRIFGRKAKEGSKAKEGRKVKKGGSSGGS